MRFGLKFIIIIGLVSLLFSCKSSQKDSQNEGRLFVCDVEEIDIDKKKFVEATGKNCFFQNTENQSDDYAYSGKKSVKLYPGKPYGLTTSLNGIKPDDYIEVTAWRKGKNDYGVISLDGGEGFYSAGKDIVERGEDDWNKIILEYHVPPNYKSNNLKIYLWNNGSDTIYFDDLKIKHLNNKVYPEFENIPALQIQADVSDLMKLNQKRFNAFETTVLVNSDEDYSGIVLFDGNDFFNGKFRLKGDLVDHIQGQKWSYRIKLKNDFVWKHMRTFSVQNPKTRYFLHEWLAHTIFHQEDILSTRYGFVPLKVNGESRGVYAWEEHFEKQLVESQNRREGPILRFDESLFWQVVSETVMTQKNWDVDYYGASKVIPFKEGRTTADSTLNKQFVEAQKLLIQYRQRSKPISEIFDVVKLAKYYALIDLTQAYHGFTWHNQRFYYNPVTCLLEPIAFDGYTESGVYKRIDEQVTGLLDIEKLEHFKKEELMLFQAFSDTRFRKEYVFYLKEFSKQHFYEGIISNYKSTADSIEDILQKEFPYYEFDFEHIVSQAKFIEKNIKQIEKNTGRIGECIVAITNDKFVKDYSMEINGNILPFMVHAYFNAKKEQLEILNYNNSSITILGAFMEEGFPVSFEEKPKISAYNGGNANSIILPLHGKPVKVLCKVEKHMFESEVSQWAYSNDETARQKVNRQTLPQGITINNDTIIFEGEFQFSSDVVIPEDYIVLAKAGTQIDLIEGASFFSASPVKFMGTNQKPVRITSSDNSANGFNILQTSGKSEFKSTHFSGLSNLRRDGWQTPSAVTFYEADVKIVDCVFTSNYQCDDALNIVRSNFETQGCTFKNTFADAFDSDFSTGTVRNCIFENIGNDAIDFSGSKVNIYDCRMLQIGDKAISGGENSNLNVVRCTVNGANIGVAAKDLTHVNLEKIILNKTAYGLVAFVKKPEYGPATITVDDLKMKNNVIFHQIELGSSLTINGKKIEGREKSLATKLYQ